MTSIPQPTPASAQTRPFSFAGLLAFLFGLAAYAFFFATFLYMIAFIADLPGLPKTIDSGPVSPAPVAIAINLALLALFAVQHSVMARPAFKRAWTLIVPKPIERSTYVLAATLAVVLLIWQWRPLPDTVWNITDPLAASIQWTLFAAGWATLLLATFLINHFELFGLQQSFGAMIGRKFQPQIFRTPFLYKFVRHPLYLGFVMAFFAAVHMTQGRMLFALASTAYILVGIFFEERDMVAQFGDTYRRYQKRVPMLLPVPRNDDAK